MGGKLLPLLLLAAALQGIGVEAWAQPATRPPSLGIHLREMLPSNPESRTQEIVLGIEAPSPMPYKLVEGEQILSAGLLERGVRTIPLTLALLLQPMQTFDYSLHTRWQEREAERRFQIRVTTEATPDAGAASEGPVSVTIPALLSLYLGNRLLYQEPKYSFGALADFDFQRMPGTDPKPNVSASTNPAPMPGGISVLTLAAAAISKINEIRKERKQRKMELEAQKKESLDWVLIKRAPDGSQQKVKAHIQLRLLDIPLDR